MFGYLSPLIFPLFGEKDSQIGVCLDITKILQNRAISEPSGTLRVECQSVILGKKCRKKVLKFKIEDLLAKQTPQTIFLSENAESLGYMEVSLSSEKPIFRRLDLAVGYSLYSRGANDAFTVIPDTKFARPILIDPFRDAGRFSLVHSATFASGGQKISNSLFFVNPYERAILVKLRVSNGKKQSVKINVKEAKMVSLETLLDPDTPNCLQLTANNRIPAWDIKHASGSSKLINSVDHLDVFRGTKARQPTTLSRFAKDWMRDKLQHGGFLR